MHLKKLEIAGFKSFADKTVIEFVDGVTAVVGPNGSGKSNITEAIRWVLGEQSAKNLRGGKMHDVIFAGSATRKPLNIAEVTLVLDNGDHFLPLDFSEVSVTRRLYRSGESDYFINKQTCRLKDVVDLFMDSGLGKESFSIISQGKVESIFNSKPEERRGIFEEAAGVLKYKQRKKQAEQKLAETEDNLSRVYDIIYELETQVEPLREQSSIAKDYLSQKEQLTDLDIALTVHEIDDLKAAWEDSEKQLTTIKQRIGTIQTTLQEKEVAVADIKAEQQATDTALETLQNKLLATTESLKQVEGEQNVLSERSKFTSENAREFKERLDAYQEKINQYEAQSAELLAQIDVKKAECTDLRKQLSVAETDLANYAVDQKVQLQALQDEYIADMQKQTSLRNDLQYLEKDYVQNQQKNRQAHERYQNMLTKQQTLETETAQLTTDLTEINQKITAARETYKRTLTNLEKNKKQLDVQEKNMYQAMGTLQQTKARHRSLNELSDDYAGFYQGVKAILKAKQQVPGIIGAVAELIQVPEDKAVAIDIALGASSQHVIVKDEVSGRAAIQYLKEKHAGRATFLPLTTIKSKNVPADVLAKVQQDAAFVGVASELIQYDAQVKSVVHNLLGRTLVAKDLKGATHLAQLVKYQFRIVSLEGDVMNVGGSMTGGATKQNNQNSILSRKNELVQLTAQMKRMEVELDKAEEQVKQLKMQIAADEKTLEVQRTEGEQLRKKAQGFETKLEINENQYQQTAREQKAFAFESEEVQTAVAEYEKQKVKLTKEQNELAEKMAALDEQIQGLNQSQASQTAAKEQALQTVNDLKAKIGITEEQLQQLQQNYETVTLQLKEVQENHEKVLQQVSMLSTNSADHADHIVHLQTQVENLQKEKLQIETELEKIKVQKQNLQHTTEESEQQLNRLYNQQQAVLEEKSQADMQRSRADMGMETRLAYLNETYDLTYEAAKLSSDVLTDLEASKRQVKLLKQGIDELGAVNLGAIDEFARVSERFDFLTTQKADLLNAKESLYEAMAEMDDEVATRFMATFEDIKDRFAVVFPRMFNGGHAELRLTDPENVLTTGIEIIAQPPGKKLQNLSLLSGGERALTAIALLFAIIQVRPIPFCILDEVEAALDEANVARFGRYLSHFDGDTQFIVITHRKGTMEEANVLYGVTMQESGVSKIVSVRLEDVDEKGKIQLTNEAKTS